MFWKLQERLKDWKELLDPSTKETLRDIIQKTQQYAPVIVLADDSSLAQIWIAIAILKKEVEEKLKLLDMAIEPWKAIINIGNLEKRRVIEKMLTEIIQPKDKEQKDIVDKLVDSLMKF